MNTDPYNVVAGGPDRARILKDEIRDLGQEVDSYKARTAAAMGGGVFLVLLGTGGIYDLAIGNYSIAVSIGISQPAFRGGIAAVGAAGLALLVLGLLREKRKDHAREARLVALEEELTQEIAEQPTSVHGEYPAA